MKQSYHLVLFVLYFLKGIILQFLLRHREILTKIKFIDAYKIMLKGSKDYLETIKRK